jgi:hypothetical protein
VVGGKNVADREYFDALRKDLASVCCAAAFVSQPGIWPSFTAWLAEVDQELTQPLDNTDDIYAVQMMESILRIDRMMMVTLLLDQPDDADISRLLEGDR